MTVSVPRSDVDRFRSVIAARLGLFFEDRKVEELGSVLAARVSDGGFDAAGRCLDWLAGGQAGEEWRALARDLTVGETFFFRYPDQFRAFAETILPALAAETSGGPIEVLSAGCASGEEAYSLAICAKEQNLGRGGPRPLRIRAFDVNPAALRKAREARYGSWSLRETPAALRDRHFKADGRMFVLAEDVCASVEFEERNLADGRPLASSPGAVDVVFCRNVLMYFSPPAAREAIARLAWALKPGGFLFLGHAETLRGLSDDFDLLESHGAFFYRKKSSGARPIQPRPAEESPASDALPGVPDVSWAEEIGWAAERIAALDATHRGAAASQPDRPTRSLGDAEALLGAERFREALGALAGLPRDLSESGEARLIRATALTNSGELRAAEEACLAVLAGDPVNPGAHYLLALCKERGGDLAAAADCDREAVRRDPTFSMAKLHAGILARKAGRREDARRHLREAALLLASERPSRILLFGGGLGRSALLEACRAELRACGDPG